MAKLKDIGKVKAARVMGIDCSTYSLAYSVIENDVPVLWGIIHFEGADVFERMTDAASKVRAIKHIFKADYICFESAILAKVQNADTTIKLAMVYGACIAELRQDGTKVVTCKPLEWQSFIGNPNFTKAEKDAVKKLHAGKSAGWYQQHIRELRKLKTLAYFNGKWGLGLTDDNVGDSMGLAYFAYHRKTTR